MIDLETPSPTDDRQKGPKRVLVAGLLAAAAVVAIALVATRDDDATPADQPSPTVTVPPTTPPRPLPNAHGRARAWDVLRRRGRRNTDAADLRHHRRRVGLRRPVGPRARSGTLDDSADDIGIIDVQPPRRRVLRRLPPGAMGITRGP